MRRLFIRVDDVGRYSSRFHCFDTKVAHYDMPVSYAVIPGLLDTATATFLKTGVEVGRMDVTQHGYLHLNHGMSECKFEFSDGRTSEQQSRDIGAGKKILESYDLPIVGFVPPWHELNEDTLHAIYNNGLNLVSSGPRVSKTSFPEHVGLRFVDVTCMVDLIACMAENVLRATLRQLQVQIATYHTVGVLFHHEEIQSSGHENVLDIVLRAIVALVAKYEVKICVLSQMIPSLPTRFREVKSAHSN